MPSRSSDMTEQESGKRELSMASKAPKAEVAAEELVAERLPDEVEASVEVNTDAVAEAAAEVVEDTTAAEVVEDTTDTVVPYDEFLEDGRVRIDAIDDQILELIERRIEVAGGLLAVKHARRIDLRDKLRQGAMLDRLTAAADTLNEHQVRELYELFIRLGVERFRKTVIDGRRVR